MEALAGLSIACNVLQIVSFVHDTFSLCKRLYENGEADPTLSANAKAMAVLTKSLRDTVLSAPGAANPVAEADHELERIAKECLASANRLTARLEGLGATEARRSLTKTAKSAFKLWWRSGEFQRLVEEMHEYQKTLDSGLILRICSSTEAMTIQNRQDYDQLDHAIQKSVQAIATGENRVAKVIEKMHKDMSKQFSILQSETVCMRLLKSLKYEGMNERRNTIKLSHTDTFRWIFRDNLPTLESNDPFQSSDSTLEEPTTTESHSDNPPPGSSHSDKRPSDSSVQSNSNPETSTQPTQLKSRVAAWDSFSEWLKSDDKIYWISGKPGSGKSTLMLFLITDQATNQGLKIWNDKSQIISHFLWSFGDQGMQQNIKGTLCSLLYQVLDDDRELSSAVIGRFQRQKLTSKDQHSDWSRRELEDVLDFSLRASNAPTCIFLDGLDEIVPSEGAEELWYVLEKLSEIPNVKMCLSSRPEPAFREQFSHYAKLRLEDLTKRDIRNYVTGEIASSLSAFRIKGSFGYHILINIICDKADGVFLWVVLVIRSLKRGMSNKDSWHQLQTRIEKCPSDLQKLFNDMWSRLREDEEIYLPTAAMFFNYVLIAPSFHGISPWEVLAATDDEIQADLLGLGPSICPERLSIMCEEVVNKIDAQCAGLLECSRPDDGSCVEPIYSASPYKGIFSYVNMRIRFVHRTAMDYLTGTGEGSQLLSHDRSTKEEREHRLIRAHLTHFKMWGRTDLPVRFDFESFLANIHEGRKWPWIPSRGSGHERLSLLWYSCSIAFSKHFLSHPWNKATPPCMFRKRPGLVSLLASCLYSKLVLKYARFQNLGRKSTYLSYIMVCASYRAKFRYLVDSFWPAFRLFFEQMSLLGFDPNFRGVSPLELRGVHHSSYLNPQSAGTRAILALFYPARNLSILLQTIENMIELGFSLDSSDVYSFSNGCHEVLSDFTPSLHAFQCIFFRAKTSLLLHILLERVLGRRHEGTLENSRIEALIQRLLLQLPETHEDQETAVLAFQQRPGGVVYLPASSQKHVELLSWLTSTLRYCTGYPLVLTPKINGAFIWDYFDSITDTCEAVPLQQFHEQLAREGSLVPVEEYWETVPRLSDEEAEMEWKRLEADVKKTKIWNPLALNLPSRLE